MLLTVLLLTILLGISLITATVVVLTTKGGPFREVCQMWLFGATIDFLFGITGFLLLTLWLHVPF